MAGVVPSIAPYVSTYEKCKNRTLILPLMDESKWSDTTRAILYFIGLLYSFLGVAILADVFMCAIERITSCKRKVKLKPGEVPDAENGSTCGEYKEVLVWNPTVANLTLMALGSSAPEILLSIIEIVGNDFGAGDLGPGTIVGSAAYNLLVITAVCIVTLQNGETKRIENILVFIVTTVWATFAYIWLIIILLGFSPYVIEVWEATLTLLFFFALVITAYLADIKICDRWRKKKQMTAATISGSKAISVREPDVAHLRDEDIMKPLHDLNEDFVLRWRDPHADNVEYHPEWREIERTCARQYPDLSPEELAKLVAYRIEQNRPHSRLWYRILAVRQFASSIKRKEYFDPAARAAQAGPDGGLKSASDSVSLVSATLPQGPTASSLATEHTTASERGGTLVVRGKRMMVIEFAARVYVVDPNKADRVRLRVVRRGRTHKKVMFRYETLNGTAKKNSHYLNKAETLVFQPGETEKLFSIDLVNEGGEWKEKELFYVKLELDPTIMDDRIKVGQASPAEIIYLPKEPEAVQIEFVKDHAVVRENEGIVRLAVVRKGSAKEPVVVEWSTEDITAQQGKDYEGSRGELHFAEGEREKYLDVHIIDDVEVEKTETFAVMLTNTSHGSTGRVNRAIVTILNDDRTSRFLTKLDNMVPRVLDSMALSGRSWRDQIMAASAVNDGDSANATLLDCFTHMLAFPWKVLCAFIPPPRVWGGWLCFIVALAMIGLLTAIVGDLASIFGCTVGLSDAVTAITFVALGTSLPDTFASRVAAVMDRTADNAIGNVTGSNSVNVFLGLGLPWFVASIVWSVRGKPFKVMDENNATIGFSVTIYTVFSLICIALLFARRYLPIFGRAELGGPTLSKWLSAIFLVFLWFIYILVSSLQAHNKISGF